MSVDIKYTVCIMEYGGARRRNKKKKTEESTYYCCIISGGTYFCFGSVVDVFKLVLVDYFELLVNILTTLLNKSVCVCVSPCSTADV